MGFFVVISVAQRKKPENKHILGVDLLISSFNHYVFSAA